MRTARLEDLRGALRRRPAVRLTGLLAADVVALAQKRLAKATFKPLPPSPLDSRKVAADPVLRALLISRLNEPSLLKAVETILGRGPVAGFFGQLYRQEPGNESYLRWHGDVLDKSRLAALTITLNETPFEGGTLQIRRRGGNLLARIDNARAGDAVLFRISPTLEHRNTPVTGNAPKLTFSGWFFDIPLAEIERRIAAKAFA